MRKIIISTMVLSGLVMLPTACGFKDLGDPGYEPYEKPSSSESTKENAGGTNTSTSTTDTADCPDKATDFFVSKVEHAIDNSCASCHNRAGHPLPLLAGETDKNRAALRAWAKGDGANISNWIKSDPPHDGGDQSSALPQGIPETWIEYEIECGN